MVFNKNDMYIGRSIKEYGEWSQAEIDLCKQILTSTDIVIGSSKVNSFDFVSHETKTFIKENGVRVFQFFVDGELIKEALYNEKTKEITSKSKFVFNSANCEIVEKRNFRDNDIQTDEEADKIDEKSLKEIKEGK